MKYLLLFLLLPLPLYGQSIEVEPVVVSAIHSIESGNSESALDPLEEVFELAPAWYSDEHASIAYWLGRAYFELEYYEDAREVWTEGIDVLTEENLFDGRLAISMLDAIYHLDWKEDYALGASLYSGLLQQWDILAQPETTESFQIYFDALQFVLPTPLKDKLGLEDGQRLDEFSWSSFTGEEITAWWRGQDPAPATRVNELLIEHLQRIAYARTEYAYENQLDDRAAVYIRLGPPSSITRVQFDKTNFRNKVLDRSLTINESDFPDNEFWYYDHIDDTAHFLFHNKSGPFVLGDVMNLVPSSIRSGLGSSERGKAKARYLVKTLEEIYRQLSLYHKDYSLRYQEVASFSSMLDEAEIAAETAALSERDDDQIDTGQDGNLRDLLANNRGNDFSEVGLPGSSFNPNRPDLYAQSVVASDRASDDMHMALREEYVPLTRSSVFDDTAPLPLFIRSARFLASDGTTRTEVYWAASPGALAIDDLTLSEVLDLGYNPDDYLIVTSSVQKRPDYTERAVNYQRQLVSNAGLAKDISILPQTISLKGDTGLYHIAVQWDQVVAQLDDEGTPVDTGPRVKANVFRQDSLQALQTRFLEMSDLKPMVIMEADQLSTSSELAVNEPIVYPAPTIKNDRPIILYFELYNLTFGEDDQTQYSIEYTIEEMRGSKLRLGRRRTASTSFKSTEQGADRNTSEQLILDLSEWRGEGDIQITVTVTDEHSRQSVIRTIRYTLVS